MGSISDALGQGSEWKFKDKTYKVKPWTLGVQGRFERYLEGHALAGLQRIKAALPAEEYRDQLSRHFKDVATGEYSWGGERLAKALQSIPHVKQLFFMMLEDNEGITKELVDEMVNTKLEEIYDQMNAANPDPNSETPETPKP